MKLYFIRHGQSEANIKGTHAGWGDFPLTEQGRLDAVRAKKSLSGVKFDKAYSSDLCRAVETQRIALPDVAGEQTTLLREINVGSLTGIPFEEAKKSLGEEYSVNRKNYAFENYGGESYADFCVRVRKFFSLVEKSPYENVAAFCHGGFINTALDVVAGRFLEREIFKCDNCSISVFEFKDGKWSLNLWNYMGDI